MANVTMTQVSNALKEVYEDRIAEQYSDEVVFGKRIEKTSDGISDMIGGKYLDFPIEVARNPGISYRAEGEALGNPGAIPYVQVKVPVFAGYGRVRFTGHVEELANNNKRAFADMARRNMDSLKKAAVKDAGRIFYGDGTGLLATVAVVSGPGNTIIVSNAEGYNVTVGMEVDVLVITTGAALVTTREVTSVVKGVTNTTITVNGATFTTLLTHGVFRAGNYTGAVQREPTGMNRIADSAGILHQVNPATDAVWSGVEYAMGGALTESQMGRIVDDVRVNGGKTSAIFCSLGVRRSYAAILRANRQFHNTTDFAGGYKGLAFHWGEDIPLIDDVDCPNSTMFFVDESNMSIRQPGEWKFIDSMGSMFEKVSGFDMYDVTMRKFWELCTYQRNAQGVLRTITES
jgi:hypothetical protein